MEALLRVAAALGVLIALSRLLTASWRLLRRGVDVVVADEMARARAHRGDLTGLEEARGEAERARQRRRGGLARAALWLAVLAVPPFTPWPLWLYASTAAVATMWAAARAAPSPPTRGVSR
jgi:hypothetical protein